MSGTICRGPKCDAETANGLALCKRCRTTASVALENVATYHADLFSLGGQHDLEKRRATGVTDPTGTAASREDTERDPADLAAAETKAQLVGWTIALQSDRPGLDTPRDTVLAISRFLAKHLASIATLEWAGEFLRELLVLERRLRTIVERGKGRWYAGICSAVLEPERPHDQSSCTCACHLGADDCDVEGGSCGPEYAVIAAVLCQHDLYAIPGTSYVRCPICRTSHSVTARRSILLEEARETVLPLGTIAQVCVSLLDGEPSVERLYKRISKWTERGQLEDYGVRVLTGKPQRVYRLGDVLDTLIGEVSTSKRRTS